MISSKNNILQLTVGTVLFSNWQPQIEIEGQLFNLDAPEFLSESASQSVFNYSLLDGALGIRIHLSGDYSTIHLKSEISNYGKKSIKLGKFFLLNADIDGLVETGDQLVVLPWQVWSMQKVYEINSPEMPELAKVLIQFQNNTKNRALQVGFVSFQRENTELLIQRDEHGIRHLKAYCDFAQWELHPQQSTASETLRILYGNNSYEQLESWADEVKDRLQPKIWDEAPLGYLGGWADCFNGSENYLDLTMANLDAVNERLGGFGFKYLWTSMANFEGSLPGNWLQWNYERLPCGRENFIRAVYERGFIPGFWVGPFYLCSMIDNLMTELGEAVLETPEGKNMIVCAEWKHGEAGRMPKKDRPCLYALDPSHPKTLNFIRKVFSTYREWGIRYYMVDFLEAGAGNICNYPYKESYDKNLVPGPEIYTNFLRTMKESAGEDAYLLSSTGPGLHHAGILDGVRVGNDFGESRPVSKESFFYPASFIINNLDFWTGPVYALACQAANYFTHRKLYLNDSGNVLTVDKPIPYSHAQINATIHAFSGGPSMLGDDIRQIADARLDLIKKTVPRSRDCGRPLDLFSSLAPDIPTRFVRDVETKWGRFKVLAIYNFSSETIKRIVSFEEMGLDASKDYLIWDFWNEKFCGSYSGSSEFSVNPESVRVLRIAEADGQIQLLATDMHIMMGENEITEFSYDPLSMVCSFRADRPVGERGMVFIYVPQNICVKNIDGLHIAKDGNTNSLIIGVPLCFDGNGVKKDLFFEWIEKPVEMERENFA